MDAVSIIGSVTRMPFVEPVNVARRRTRIHITGETYTGKTQSLLTFPAPRLILNYPGEGGYDTLPVGDPSTIVRIWEPKRISPEPPSAEIIEEVWQATVEALKRPGLHTFAGDGLHKLMTYVMDAMSGGKWFEGAKVGDLNKMEETLAPAVWGQAERWMSGYLNLVKQSSIPYVVFTSWDADKRLRRAKAGEHWSQVPTAKQPALLGPMARTILGEFTVTLHSSRGRLSPNDSEPTWRWQTKPDAGVIGCGIKAPSEVVDKIPKYIKQVWGVLAGYLEVNPHAEEGTS